MSTTTVAPGLLVLDLFADRGASPVMTPARLNELENELDVLARRDDLGLVMLRGGSRAFCLGAEIAFFQSASPKALHDYLDGGRRVCDRIASLPVPTVAAVNGLALGGGFEFALACDMCWIDRRAGFGFPEASAGLVPTWGGVERAMTRLPRSQAWELLLGRRIGAAGAESCGLATRVFESRDFHDAALAEATRLAALAPQVLRALKRTVLASPRKPANAATHECLALLAEREPA